jgi:hypothetical protein
MTTQRKNFDRAYRLHAACAISEVQPELAYITFRKGYAYASDGHMAARAKVETIATGFHPDELQRLEGKTIHMDNFRRLLNYAVANVTEQGFEVNDQGRRLLIYFAEQQTIMFDREMTDIFDTCTITNSMHVYKIGISANQLRKASQVIGTDRLRANFFVNDGNQRIYIHLTGIQQAADIDIVIYDQIMEWR